jgi:hypothetical protein
VLSASKSFSLFIIRLLSYARTLVLDVLSIIALTNFINSFFQLEIHTSFFSLFYATASHIFLCLSWSMSSVYIKDENVVLFSNFIFFLSFFSISYILSCDVSLNSFLFTRHFYMYIKKENKTSWISFQLFCFIAT